MIEKRFGYTIKHYINASFIHSFMCCSGGIWPGGKTVLVFGCFGAQ